MTSLTACLDAIAQAELVRRNEVAPHDLVDAAIETSQRIDPELHAILHPAFDAAREVARSPNLPDGPLRGVPILLSDLGACEAGKPYHRGMGVLRTANYRAAQDSFIVEKLRAAGTVCLGRTNVAELGLVPMTEPSATGPTGNPWCPTHSAGGSGGGAAAAVAAGFVAAAHGPDGGGSLRITASMCSLVGLKPSRGRASMGPQEGETWGALTVEGFVTRSVRDSARFLDVIAGNMPGDFTQAPATATGFEESMKLPTGSLRVGMLASGLRGLDIAPACVKAVKRAAELLTSCGHHVEAAYPVALDEQEMVLHYLAQVAAHTAQTVARVGDDLGRALVEEDMEPLTWAMARYGRKLNATDLLSSQSYIHTFTRRLGAFWDKFDLLLTPTIAVPPPELGALKLEGDHPLREHSQTAPFGVYTMPFNLSGQPAISMPGHFTEDGLPVGYQLVAALGKEDLLLQVAAQLEAAAPFAGRRPELAG